MNRRIISLFTILPFAVIANAQVVKIDSLNNWKKDFKASFNLNQAATSNNWNAGVINVLGLNAALNYKANYAKENHSWQNEFDFLYGTLNANKVGFRKSADRIFLDSKYGYKISSTLKATGGVNILTQFANGYQYEADPNNAGSYLQYLTSGFLAPCYVTIPIGVEYAPTSYFSVNVSPVSPRFTIVRVSSRFMNKYAADPNSPFGVKSSEGENHLTQIIGLQTLAKFDKDILPNINLKWQYLGFLDWNDVSYEKFNHRLDLSLTAKIYKSITVGFSGILLYNAQQNANVQWSELFTIGYLYSFKNFK